MSWQCRLIHYNEHINGSSLKIGDMFYGPTAEQIKAVTEDQADKEGWYWPYFHCKESKLSDYYKQNNSNRRPLLVWLPGRILFCVDSACWDFVDGKMVYSGGWTVTGEAPNITVSPSINCKGVYHGWLQNGVISEDCEGRKFNENGGLIR